MGTNEASVIIIITQYDCTNYFSFVFETMGLWSIHNLGNNCQTYYVPFNLFQIYISPN